MRLPNRIKMEPEVKITGHSLNATKLTLNPVNNDTTDITLSITNETQ